MLPEQLRIQDSELRTTTKQSHEEIGAAFLRMRGFSNRVTTPIINHVRAKRYLTRVDPGCHEKLSYASKETLALQGGVMSELEAIEFEREPQFEESLLVRRWDDEAKKKNQPVLNLDIIRSSAQAALLNA